MNFTLPHIPVREEKPRSKGLTMMMDKGLSIRQAEDFLSVSGYLTDIIKLGFGTSFVTPNLEEKIKLYKSAGMKVYVGGTLFEAFIVRNMFDQYQKLIDKLKLDCAEVSDGSIVMPHDKKCEYINKLSKNFTVFSEVGSKEAGIIIHPAMWISMMNKELQAGSWKVIAEARESGNVGTVSCNSVNGNITTVTSGTAGINFRVNLDSHLNIAPSTGDIELGATDPTGTQNLVTIKTVLPTGSTSSSDAFLKLDSGGQIDIRAEKDLVVYSTAGGVDVESFDELYLNSKTAGISIQLFSGEAGYVDLTPGQGDSNAMGGAVLYDCGDFNPAKNYGIGAVVVYLGETWVSTKYNIGSTTPPVAGPEWFKLSGSSGTGVTGLTTPVGSGLSLSAATGAVIVDTTIGAGPGVNVVRGTTGTDLTISNAGIIELTTANGCGITQINEAGIVALSANLLAGTGVSLAPSGSNTDITINLTYPKMLTGTWQVTTRDSISTNSFIIQYGQATPPSDTAAVTYDNVTNVGRFTVVTPGLYQITLSTAFNAQDLVLPTQHTLDCLINVFTNGGVQNSVACQTLCMAEPPLDNIYALTTTTVKLLAGEYWTTQTFLRTGGNLFPGGFYYVEPPANDVSNGTSCTWVLLSAD